MTNEGSTGEEDEDQKTEEPPSPYSITESQLRLRLHREDCGRKSTQIFVVFIACLGSISFGTTLGWSRSITRSYHDFDDPDYIWMSSLVPLGCFLGISSATFLLDHVGPRKALRAIAPFYIVSWAMVFVDAQKLVLAARFFLGFLGISYHILGDNLLQQTIHFRMKRYATVFLNSSMLFGLLIAVMVEMVSTQQILTIVCILLPIVHVIMVSIVPESPIYLYATSHLDAHKSLKWYRGTRELPLAFSRMRKDFDVARHDPDSYKYMLFAKVVYRPLLVIVVIVFCQATSGYFIYIFFSISIWSPHEVAIETKVDAAIAVTSFVVLKLFWDSVHAVFRFKVRRLLIWSCVLCALQQSCTATYLYIESREPKWFAYIHWFPLLFMVLFVFVFNMGLNYYPSVLVYEYMPFQIYKTASYLTNIVFWMFIYANILTYASLRTRVQPYTTFAVIAGLLYLGALFCYLAVIEPRDRSLVQLQRKFGGNPIGRRSVFYRQGQPIT